MKAFDIFSFAFITVFLIIMYVALGGVTFYLYLINFVWHAFTGSIVFHFTGTATGIFMWAVVGFFVNCLILSYITSVQIAKEQRERNE